MSEETQTPESVETPIAEATETVETAQAPVKEATPPPTAHDDFDWSISKINQYVYSKEERARLEGQYDKTLGAVNENEVIKAKVSQMTGGDAVLDINFKSDGLVALSEFKDIDGLKIGDEVDVYVERQEDEKGQLVLSRRKAKLLKAWERLVDSFNNGTIINGTVISKTKGGLIVDAGGLETFLPGSQIDIKQIVDYDQFVGKTMEFKVVKINENIKNAVVSHKALIESDLAEQREAIISGLEKGQVLEGVVKNITDFGAFMDLGGVDGLLYITDISWGRINHPSEVLEINQKVHVVVLDFDENKKRISLGLKQLQPHPWDVVGDTIKEGDVVKGKIVNVEDYGAFLEITPGVEGLIHVSEVSWSNQPIHARDYFTVGQEYECKVVTIDHEERKMSLSLKQLTPDPWAEIEKKYPVGSKHTGRVQNLTPYGVFVELEDGIGGMVHISDLSWTKRFAHPSEFTKVGADLQVQILDIDRENRKLSLGHKHVEENPWDTFENVFPVGSYHEATVIKRDDKGAIVQLPYGLEAFSPSRHLRKENGKLAEVDDTLTFKVIEFNRDDKRIMVSHLRYLEDIQREAEDVVKEERKKQGAETTKAIKEQQSKYEPTTLGDMAMFTQLKEQLGESKPKAEAKTETKVKAEKVEAKEEAKAEEKEEVKAEETPVVESAPVAEESAPVAEEPAPVAEEAAPKAKASKAKASGDDLKIIEGIGPKIAEILHAAGINTFAELAAANPESIRGILAEQGSRFKVHDPETWPKQAQLAVEGKMDELQALKDSLKGGKE
ncbi:MAG TPA: 30S ribosomal protein S1 [Saprospiraceae bacterium]|nr:30S ribosomal protein S1 [Saprospiraceae bacterium]